MDIITFTSDFGEQDWFVAAVKGEILKINPRAKIIDISHTLSPFNIRAGAFLLKNVYRNFPEGTVHLAVVDPGVGSKRKPIIVFSENYYFVGPDNGIFSYIYNSKSRVYEIIFKQITSSTFHARDIFGPVSAYLSKGERIEKMGREIKRYIKFEFPKLKKIGKKIYGEVVYIDSFGNLITNIPNSLNLGSFKISQIGKKVLIKDSYSEGKKGEFIGIKGSCGYYEIALNQGSAADLLNAKIGFSITGELT